MEKASQNLPTIAVIGGTGDLGRGIALRAAAAGYQVCIGSRSADRAQSAAEQMQAILPSASISGADYADAAKQGDIVVLAIPYSAHSETVAQIRPVVGGKIVVDTTVPLCPPKVMRVQIPQEGTAASQTARALGDSAKVTAAFHSVAAAKLGQLDLPVDCDILVFGDDPDAREPVVQLAQNMKLTAWHAGPLANAIIGEALTSTLIFLNKKYKIEGAGIKISGEPKA